MKTKSLCKQRRFCKRIAKSLVTEYSTDYRGGAFNTGIHKVKDTTGMTFLEAEEFLIENMDAEQWYIDNPAPAPWS
jgi:hypothetical protein